MSDEVLSHKVEDMLLTVLVEANYDIEAALTKMGGENRTLRKLFEAMKAAMKEKN
jgi:hypothetical protein